MRKCSIFLLIFITYMIGLINGSNIENLKTLDDIIISEDETKIYSLDEYFTNSNLKFSVNITNKLTNLFTITLSESFNNLLHMEIEQNSNLRRVKNLESINSLVVLYEASFMVIHWEAASSFISHSCSRFDFNYNSQSECTNSQESANFLCHDFEEISNSNYYTPSSTYIVVDCDDKLTSQQIFFFMIINVGLRSPFIYLLHRQNLNVQNYLNNTRKMLYDNNTRTTLYRYSPYSLKVPPDNISIIQVYSQNFVSFQFIKTIPNITQYLESIQIINGSLLMLDYYSNLTLFNIINQNYTNSIQFNLTSNESSIQISYYYSRLFILTNSTVYRMSISDQNKSSVLYSLNIPDENWPQAITQTQDYLYVLFPKYLKILRIDDISTKKMLDSLFQQDFLQNLNEKRILLKFPDQYFKNSYVLWCSKGKTNHVWSFNITQIQKKLLFVHCCNITQYPDFNPLISMQNFSFNLIINENYSSVINIYYWNINDFHLYFDPAMSSFYDNSQSLTYSFDSENILIPYTNWVTGPLKIVKIQSITPPSHNFKVDCHKSFNVSFDYLKKNNNIDINYNSISNSEFLSLTLNSTHLTMYWQTSKDLSFYIIDCFIDANYFIEDCVISFINDQYNKSFSGALRYKNFHIINTRDGLLYVRAYSYDEINENQEISDLPYNSKNVYCDYIYLYETKDIFFCQSLANEILIRVYRLKTKDNDTSLTIDNEFIYYFTDDLAKLSQINKFYIDFIEMFNCFIVYGDNKLIFFEILLPSIGDPFIFSFTEKYQQNLNNFTDIYLINKEIPLIILIDYVNDVIEEYTLRLSLDVTLLRNYPTFNYNFVSSFKCNDRFLCLNIIDKRDMNNYIVIYNVTEPTSKLLRNKILYDPNNDKIYPIVVNENNDLPHAFFHNLFTSSSVFVTLNPKSGISISVYKVCDIIANIPEVFHDPNLINQQYYKYTLITSFTNEMMQEMIFFKIIVNISLSNSIITLNGYNNSVLNLVDPELDGSNYIINITEFPYFGPIKNYKIYNDYFVTNNEIYYYDFYPFVQKIIDFEEEYKNVLNFYGDFIKALYKDGILIVLSEKNLTFHNVYSQNYEILYNDKPGNDEINCKDMLLHNIYNLLFVICTYKDGLILKSYEYNLTNFYISHAFSTILQITKYNVTGFKTSFENYISVVMSDYHIFFLVDEGYYLELHKKRKTIYIFDVPKKNNNTYECGPPATISDTNFNNSSFLVMSDAVDLQTYFVKNFTENSTFYVILVLMNTSLRIIKVNLTMNTSEAVIIGNYTIENLTITKSSYNNDYVFYTVTLLNFNILDDSFQNSTQNNFTNFTLTYILSSNLHIYEYNTTILNETNFITKTNHVYTKYYSCIFTDLVRPRKFKSFVGSFCTKTDVIDGISENGINYFILHKIHDDNEQILSPILALPIYLKNYNFQFISNYTNDYLILPSFSSLFTAFELKNFLYLSLRNNPNALSTKITAYNEISNTSIILNIILTSKENSSNLNVILVCVFSVFAFIIILLIIFYLRHRKYKNTTITRTESEIDEYLMKSRLSDVVVNDNMEKLKKIIGNESTSFGSHFRTTSYLRVKLKNEKWMES